MFWAAIKNAGRDSGIFDAISVVFAAVLYGYTVYITAKRRHFAAETDVDGLQKTPNEFFATLFSENIECGKLFEKPYFANVLFKERKFPMDKRVVRFKQSAYARYPA